MNPEEIYHHPFCNFFGRPREGCKQCEMLYNNYPLHDDEIPDLNCADRLIQEYFPNIIKK